MFQQHWQELWTTVFIVLIVIGILAGQGLAIGFGVMGLLLAATSWVWNQLSLQEVTYTRELSQQRVFIGEEISMTVVLTNGKPIPLGRLEVEDEVPKQIHIADAQVTASSDPHSQILHHSTSMAWYERIRWKYRITCSERGYHRLGPTRLKSGDLFGFFDSRATIEGRDYLLVYPKVVPLPELGLPSVKPLGEASGGISLFRDPSMPSGIREYQRGDPLKTVDWKASARMQSLQVRTFEPTSTLTVILTVVVETTARYWEGYSPVNLERVITTAASVAKYAAENEYNLGLFSNGTPILTDRPLKVPPNRSPEQLMIVLEALATIMPLPMGPMAPQLAAQTRRFPIGATLVVVTALVLPELANAVSSLKHQGYGVVVLYLGDDECPQLAEGVVVHNLQDYFVRMEALGEPGPR